MSIESELKSLKFTNFNVVYYYYNNVLKEISYNESTKSNIIKRLQLVDNTYTELHNHYNYIHDSLKKDYKVSTINVFNRYFSINDNYDFLLTILSFKQFLNKINSKIFNDNIKFNSTQLKYEFEIVILILFRMLYDSIILDKSNDNLYDVTYIMCVNDNIVNKIIKAVICMFSMNITSINLTSISLKSTEKAYKSINNETDFTYVLDSIYNDVIDKCPLLIIIKKNIDSYTYCYKISINICNNEDTDDFENNDIHIVSRTLKFKLTQ